MIETLKARTIEVGGCWEWIGALDSMGYGLKRIEGKMWKTHRLMFTLVNGEIPKGLEVRHSCDNRRCCNPEHLSSGTHQENMNDMKERGRVVTQHGSKHKLAKLTESDVLIIRQSSKSVRELAELYGVSETTLGDAKRGRTWRHI